MSKVVFKHPDQSGVSPKLLKAVTQVCIDYGKDGECSAGFRTLECQKATAVWVLAKNPGSYQLKNGAVYIDIKKNGKVVEKRCHASAYGESNHCFRIAMDMNGWFEKLTNAQLKPYGLCKPITYEPWHVQLIETIGISKSQKIAIRDSYQKEESINMGKAFKDVDDNRWSAKFIEAAKELGLVSGNKDGTFAPAEPITREQTTVLMVKLYEKITGKKVL